MKKNSWINDIKKEKSEEEIENLSLNIENNYKELGKKLKEIKSKNISLTSYEKFGINEKKANQLIMNYEFCIKHNIEESINFSKLTLLTKIKTHENIDKFIEFSKNSSTLKELENFIFGKKEQQVLTKQFKLDQETAFLFEECKKIISKASNSEKMNQNEVFKNILIDFYSTNIEILEGEN